MEGDSTMTKFLPICSSYPSIMVYVILIETGLSLPDPLSMVWPEPAIPYASGAREKTG